MVALPADVKALVARIVSAYDPLQIWLFGSRARGDARRDSDWDLLAVLADDAPAASYDPGRVWREVGLEHVHADLVLLPHADFIEDRDVPNTLAYPVSREGVVLYER